ncbi:SDR family NAD(P)-dependent oxidoreductase [Gemmatimonas sp.]|uniref:SDR family NAD(P)-dependent oxidoreductase n=1 Tax=Gemmatimonas sp. TaxID=1962908 RepID=UPI003F6E4F5B
MAERMQLRGRTAVVTGAGSGIGQAIAMVLAHRGCHLALVDVNAASLAGTVALLPAACRVSQHVVDVASREMVAALPAAVSTVHDRVDLVVNNAGVGVDGTFDMVSEEDFDWLFAINFHGVVRMTRAFMPLLRASDDARLVNISSIFGIVAPAEQVAYAASKFAVRGFSEALRHELEGTRVGVTVVHPGGVRTNIADNARVPRGIGAADVIRRRDDFRKFLRMPPAKAGEIIVRSVECRKPRVLVGADAAGLALLQRLAPVSYWSLMAKGMPK